MLTRKYFSCPPKDRNSPENPVSETRNHTLVRVVVCFFGKLYISGWWFCMNTQLLREKQIPNIRHKKVL